MPSESHAPRKSRPPKTIRVAIPPTRDPFVNTPLIAVGEGPDGKERFWTSTWNANVGTIAVLIDEDGEYRIYRFPPECPGFYSAVPESAKNLSQNPLRRQRLQREGGGQGATTRQCTGKALSRRSNAARRLHSRPKPGWGSEIDSNVLWLCGWLDKVVRLDLETGKWEAFDTGAPRALVFQGMAYDPATRKLFAAAFPYPDIVAFSFDTVAKKTVKIHKGFSPAHYMRFSFPNGDGTWSILLQTPGASLVKWDPRTEEVTAKDFSAGATGFRFLGDDANRRYFPGHGWYDPKTGEFDNIGPKPRTEASWIARFGNKAYGVAREGEFAEWDMTTGKVRTFGGGVVADADTLGANFTESGKALAVNLYGNFYRLDIATGALDLAKVLPTDSIGRVDCLQRIDSERLLGTPFITQRFWEVNLKTGKGADMGRAASGGGEVLQTWKIAGKVYMAAYTKAELVEYDPAKSARFPENPSIVARAPEGMRPVAAADDGRCIYYAASAHYGCLGSTLAKYDTKTGIASYAVNPLPNQQIVSLHYDKPSKTLICGTTYNADCCSAPPCETAALFARVNPADLSVESTFAAPAGFASANVAGPLGRGHYLCALQQDIPLLGGSDAEKYFILSLSDFRAPRPDRVLSFLSKLSAIMPAAKAGFFILETNGAIELWDMRKPERIKTLVGRFDGYRWKVDGDELYMAYPKEIVIQGIGSY